MTPHPGEVWLADLVRLERKIGELPMSVLRTLAMP
jgi:hypothetical protein